MTLEAGEGYIPVDGGRVWYQIVGSGNAIPLLCLHGGPGFCHDYLETMADLSPERPVIFYDQLGWWQFRAPHRPVLVDPRALRGGIGTSAVCPRVRSSAHLRTILGIDAAR